MTPVTLRTARLLLRPWRPTDVDAFAALNADPRVMEHFPSTQDRARTQALVTRVEDHFARHGWGLWAVQVRDGAPFIGFTGLTPVPDDLPLAPATEIGWRLAAEHWGHGYATEAAEAALRFAFVELHLPEVVSMTSVANHRSQRVMAKIGLTRRPERDFDHPRTPDWSGRRHVVHAIDAAGYRALRDATDRARATGGTVGP